MKNSQNILIGYTTDQVCLKATPENTDFENFFSAVLKLKKTPRRGWQIKLGLKNPESVADHVFSVAMFAMVLSDYKKLDTQKIIKMALIHDLAESIIGDLTPEEITKSKKFKLENSAMKKILKNLNKPQSKQYLAIWNEYQKNASKEAKLLHQIDKLEMVFQAKIYQKSGFTKKQLEPFFNSTTTQVTDKTLKKLVKNQKTKYTH